MATVAKLNERMNIIEKKVEVLDNFRILQEEPDGINQRLFKTQQQHSDSISELKIIAKLLKWLVAAIIGGAITMAFGLLATVIGHYLLLGMEADKQIAEKQNIPFTLDK